MHSYGIIVNDTQLALVLLTNIKLIASEEWGPEFWPALQTIWHTNAYDYVPTGISITTILLELAGANGIRKLIEAPPSCRRSRQCLC
jgi:hypothetical protein